MSAETKALYSATPRRCQLCKIASEAILCFSILLAVGSSATAQSYFFKSIDDPNAASFGSNYPAQTFAYGLNDSGTIVGSYRSASCPPAEAFEDSAGSFSTIDFPGSCQFGDDEVYGINNSGEAVGYYSDCCTVHGYLLLNGGYTTLDFPGSTLTQVTAVNNLGVVVGIYGDANYVQHGFVYNGSFSTFDCPGTPPNT